MSERDQRKNASSVDRAHADGNPGMKRRWESNAGLKACGKALPRGKVQN